MESPEDLSKKKKELAIVGLDKEIYEYLGLYSPVKHRINSQSVVDERWCGNIVSISGRADRPYHVQPEPLDRSDLQALLVEGMDGVKGFWSVHWDSDGQTRCAAELEDDDFRVVVNYRTIQFMVRPPSERDRTMPWEISNNVKRLYIGAGDIKDCVFNVLNLHRSEKISTVIGIGLAIHPDDRGASKIPRIPFEWKIDRVTPERLNQRVYKWRVDACGGMKHYNNLITQHRLLRSGKEEKLLPPGKKPRVKLRIYGKRRNLEPVQSHRPRTRDPPPSNASNIADTTLFGVPHELSGRSVTLLGSSSVPLAPAYQEKGQSYGQSGQYVNQRDWARVPSPKGYGDDMTMSAVDLSRNRGIAPGPTPTMWNTFSPQQAALEAAGLYQSQPLPLPRPIHVSRPWESLSSIEQAQRRAFGEALAQTAADERRVEAAQQKLVEAEHRRVQAEKQKAETERRRLIEADQRRAQEQQRQAEAERQRDSELPLRPLRWLPPLTVTTQSKRRGKGSGMPQAIPENTNGGFQSGLRSQIERRGALGIQYRPGPSGGFKGNGAV